ncbi:phage tail assembly protein [Rhodoblastus acidophilus]|nr:phage tail assembly protein [Rhodoblastus acidophilus]MCW2284907.1 hypothetical protein [Rhodoblastus acidophilus]
MIPNNPNNSTVIPAPLPVATVNLSRPLMTHKGQVTSLELREPLAGSFFDHAEPFKIRVKDGRVDFDYDNAAMMRFLADMCGHDVTVLRGLAARDYMTVRTAVTDIILGLTGTEENPTNS